MRLTVKVELEICVALAKLVLGVELVGGGVGGLGVCQLKRDVVGPGPVLPRDELVAAYNSQQLTPEEAPSTRMCSPSRNGLL